MSERGSFVTQYMYCRKCRKRLKKVLCSNHHRIQGVFICDKTIIAGFLSSCGPGSDVVIFKYELFNKENAPCHPVKVALIPDSMDAEIVVVKPDGDVEDYKDFMEENPNFIFS